VIDSSKVIASSFFMRPSGFCSWFLKSWYNSHFVYGLTPIFFRSGASSSHERHRFFIYHKPIRDGVSIFETQLGKLLMLNGFRMKFASRPGFF